MGSHSSVDGFACRLKRSTQHLLGVYLQASGISWALIQEPLNLVEAPYRRPVCGPHILIISAALAGGPAAVNQELIDKGQVSVNGVRIALNMQLVE